MDKIRNLFFNYQQSFNFDSNESNSFIFKENDFQKELKSILKNKEEFIKLKDLMINNPQYPLFVYAAKLYGSDFLELFKSDDATYSLQNSIACVLACDMIYLDSTNSKNIPDMHNDFFLVNDNNKTYINPNIALKNRYLAMQYYNPLLAHKIFLSSVSYFNLYKQELDTLKTLKLKDTATVFKNLQTYHAKKYVLNSYLFDMTSNIRDNLEIFFSVLNEIECYVMENCWHEFQQDVDHIRIAFNFRNK